MQLLTRETVEAAAAVLVPIRLLADSADNLQAVVHLALLVHLYLVAGVVAGTLAVDLHHLEQVLFGGAVVVARILVAQAAGRQFMAVLVELHQTLRFNPAVVVAAITLLEALLVNVSSTFTKVAS